jgi:hypothetical protein
MTHKAPFPKPWRVEQTGPMDWIVRDAANRKLFYIVGDEGDGDKGTDDYIEPTILVWSEDEDHERLLDEIEQMLGVP